MTTTTKTGPIVDKKRDAGWDGSPITRCSSVESTNADYPFNKKKELMKQWQDFQRRWGEGNPARGPDVFLLSCPSEVILPAEHNNNKAPHHHHLACLVAHDISCGCPTAGLRIFLSLKCREALLGVCWSVYCTGHVCVLAFFIRNSFKPILTKLQIRC